MTAMQGYMRQAPSAYPHDRPCIRAQSNHATNRHETSTRLSPIMQPIMPPHLAHDRRLPFPMQVQYMARVFVSSIHGQLASLDPCMHSRSSHIMDGISGVLKVTCEVLLKQHTHASSSVQSSSSAGLQHHDMQNWYREAR